MAAQCPLPYGQRLFIKLLGYHPKLDTLQYNNAIQQRHTISVLNDGDLCKSIKHLPTACGFFYVPF